MKDRPKPIEVSVFEKDEDGYLHYKCGRAVRDIAKEIEQSLTEAGISYEYVSYERTYHEEKSFDWPRGDTYVSLQVGVNEGYRLVVYVKHGRFEAYPKIGFGGEIVYSPIWVKLLCSREDALKAHEHLFHVMGS